MNTSLLPLAFRIKVLFWSTKPKGILCFLLNCLLSLSLFFQIDCPFFFFRFSKQLCLLLSPAACLLNSFASIRSQLKVVLRDGVSTPSLSLSPSKHLPLAHVVTKPWSLPSKRLSLILVS